MSDRKKQEEMGGFFDVCVCVCVCVRECVRVCVLLFLVISPTCLLKQMAAYAHFFLQLNVQTLQLKTRFSQMEYLAEVGGKFSNWSYILF